MHTWDLPEGLQQTTLHHVDPLNAEQYMLEASIVHIAKQVSRMTDQDQVTDAFVMDDQIWQVVGLDSGIFDSVCDETQRKTAQALDLLFPRTRQSA